MRLCQASWKSRWCCSPMGALWIVVPNEGHFHFEHARIATKLASFVCIEFKMLRTERRLPVALEKQETSTGEINHRIKSVFAVSNAMDRMTLKSTNSKEDMAQERLSMYGDLQHWPEYSSRLHRRAFVSCDGSYPSYRHGRAFVPNAVDPDQGSMPCAADHGD
jgi:hypothetical protein